MNGKATLFVLGCIVFLGLLGFMIAESLWQDMTTGEIEMVQPKGAPWSAGSDAHYAQNVNVPNSQANQNNAEAETLNAQATAIAADAALVAAEATAVYTDAIDHEVRVLGTGMWMGTSITCLGSLLVFGFLAFLYKSYLG